MSARSRLVYETTHKDLAASSIVNLPLRNLAPGVYMLKILTGEEMLAFKVVVRN